MGPFYVVKTSYIHTGAGEEYRPLAEIVDELDALEDEARATDKALRAVLAQIGESSP